jgi:N-acetylglucosamine kinase-like BadF-type ATPase
MYLGIDGGGTKTAFALVDGAGRVLARLEEGSAYYVEVGLDGAREVLRRGVAAVLAGAGVAPGQLDRAFFGLPAYGEDRAAQAALDALPRAILGHDRYDCGNDMVCSWAGALACADGVSVIAGTGSMAYGEWRGRRARAGGWGELFSDEGSAHWIARAGLALFSRMSDGRAARGTLHALLRARLDLVDDLDLCAYVYGDLGAQRSRVAQLARVVAEAAHAGDLQAAAIFEAAGAELAAMVDAVRAAVGADGDAAMPVSYSGGLFGAGSPLPAAFARALEQRPGAYVLTPPRLAPVLGAALYAARQAGRPLDAAAVARLAAQ